MPIEFWKQINKVFEPCCGKGGFLIDIIDRFMDNLDIIDDEENLENISKIFNNNKFKNILKSIKFGMYYNSNIIKLFKKDFWKEFI